MSLQLTDNFSSVVKNYISNPSKQVNLATTVIRFVYYASFFLGLFLVLLSFGLMFWNPNYRNGNVTKKPLIYLGYIGVALIIFGLWSTINSFYGIVGKINENIRLRKNCSLFQYENPVNAVSIIASENLKETALANVVAEETDNLMQRQISPERAYSGIQDASTNSFTRKQLKEATKPAAAAAAREPFLLGFKEGEINPRVKSEIESSIKSNTANLREIVEKIFKNGDVPDEMSKDLIESYIANTLHRRSKKYVEVDGSEEAKKKLTADLMVYLRNATKFIELLGISKDESFFESIKEEIMKGIENWVV